MFTELTVADPNNPDNHHQLGLIEDERLQYHKAKPHYLKSFSLDSTNLKNIVKLGEYFLRYKKTDSLMRFVDYGLTQDSTSLELINLKALGHYNYQEYEKALPYFEKLINLNQHKVYIYERLGRCYNFMWEYEKAKRCYKKIFALEPGNAEAYFNLGVTHQKLKELDSALINYNEAITVQKVKFDKEYSAIAAVYREKNDVKNALENYKKAVAEDPESIFSHNQVVLLSDVYYKDPALKLKLYEGFLEKFKDHQLFELYKEMYSKRISDLKAEIHLSKE